MSQPPRPDSYWQQRIDNETRSGQQEHSPAAATAHNLSLLDYYRSIRDLFVRDPDDRDGT
ncbi:hypothetical protein R1X32_10420 (plasmid) [Rhodococcus opacus]|uniref:hypothetical protein n=1 Tax=Rhodococcus opacus TaxID=37919 RepID=UPI0034D35808